MCSGAYYKRKLSGVRLLKCYDEAPKRIQRYLESEIQFVISNIHGKRMVLELGCGYGRVMKKVSSSVSWIMGNDISIDSLKLAKSELRDCGNCSVVAMDASEMALQPGIFDAVFCIQNGISAFGVNQKSLVAESVRMTKENGIILFSTYSQKVWDARLEWFRKQSELGLIGEIDEELTGEGTIICKDGFKATTLDGVKLARLFDECGLKASIVEVDNSSVFACAYKTHAYQKEHKLGSAYDWSKLDCE
jgi:ubiquinone/menaquinone biosynthesis C-methylase UbiE